MPPLLPEWTFFGSLLSRLMKVFVLLMPLSRSLVSTLGFGCFLPTLSSQPEKPFAFRAPLSRASATFLSHPKPGTFDIARSSEAHMCRSFDTPSAMNLMTGLTAWSHSHL